MTQDLPLDFDAARKRATERRAAGVAVDFDPARLALARRLAAMPRTKLARALKISPAAVGQFEKGQARPTLPVLTGLADALDVPVDFFRAGHPMAVLPASAAHFRSLRATTVTEREQALAFGELVLSVFSALELSVDLPAVNLPGLQVDDELDENGVVDAARRTRQAMGVSRGPVPHVVRLLESHGVAVAGLDDHVSPRVDAFSHQQALHPHPHQAHSPRPLVLLNPAKEDKARGRFNAAHELGHLVLHHDTEPGSRLNEAQAHAFAAEFLAPAEEIAPQLPTRLDWVRFHELKQRWGLSLKALVMRAHKLGKLTDHSYRRGMQQLTAWGLPEPGALGELERPVLMSRAVELLGGESALQRLAKDAGLPLSEVRRVWVAAGGADVRPRVDLLN
ncbi:XRE family transcriptional regulator [Blastococcus sp. TBT05-19]|uniref:XRE family transcriptional regulator n=1 Tax=Blastococcus sp. TBT05-19 TaxID=2250581 RepID=UPI000DE9F934|nr:XRE family transcriptional regulator [Blastococcus sp. TBT05-19]RBY92237.1 XRE family transcriptional regulator [Blastococcus sp. TBT05-19]